MKREDTWRIGNDGRMYINCYRVLPSDVSNLDQEEVMGRCKGNRIYTAKNIITGEEFSGSSREIFERLNIPANSLYTYADRKSVYKKTWIFSFVDENVKESDEIPWEKWDEWDRERIRVKKWLKNKGKSKRKIEKTAVSEVT